MIKEYEVLVDSSGAFSGWVYLGRCAFDEIQKIAHQNVTDCGIFHVAVAGSLSKDEKQEIATRHGL